MPCIHAADCDLLIPCRAWAGLYSGFSCPGRSMLPLLLLGGDNRLPFGFIGRDCVRLPNAEGSWLLSMIRTLRNFARALCISRTCVSCVRDLSFTNYGSYYGH